MRTTIAPLVGLLVASCGAPEPTIGPGTRPTRAEGSAAVAERPQASSAAAAKPPAPPPAAPPTLPPDGEEEPLPEGFVAVPLPPYEESGEPNGVRCGKLEVENLRGDPRVFEPFVVVTDTTTGKKIYEAHGRRYDLGGSWARMELTASACGDVTGDGVAELLLTERTMGAHCCYTHYVTSLTSPPKLIMTWEKGDSGNGIRPVKLKPGTTWQIQSVDLVWPPFDAEKGDPSVSYAGVPGFPIVFDLVGGQYQKRTFAFLDALRKERDELRAACAKRGDCEPYELHEWGIAVMLDEWDAQKATIVPDVELRKQLDQRAADMKKKLRAQLGD